MVIRQLVVAGKATDDRAKSGQLPGSGYASAAIPLCTCTMAPDLTKPVPK